MNNQIYLLKRDDSGSLFLDERVVFFFDGETFFFFDGEAFFFFDGDALEDEEPLRVRLLGEPEEDFRFRFLVP